MTTLTLQYTYFYQYISDKLFEYISVTLKCSVRGNVHAAQRIRHTFKRQNSFILNFVASTTRIDNRLDIRYPRIVNIIESIRCILTWEALEAVLSQQNDSVNAAYSCQQNTH